MDLVIANEKLIKQVLDAAFMVHKELGPGLQENIYEKALLIELRQSDLSVESQVSIPVKYRGESLGIGYRADLIVDGSLLVELKCVDKLIDIHLSQTITYLKLLGFKRGLLVNFNISLLKNGIKRVSI